MRTLPNGYVVSGAWHGSAYPATDSADVGTTIVPENFSEVPSGDPLCVSGVVGASEDYEGAAMVIINLNQEPAAGSEPLPVTPLGDGLQLSTSQSENAPLRAMLMGPNGASDENDRWCANITEAAGGFIAYDEFNTQCWDPSGGNDYSGTPIVSIAVMVPGSVVQLPFDFCVNDIKDAN